MGNPDLLFETYLLGARVATSIDQKEKAADVLLALLKEKGNSSPKEQAAIYYELYQIDRQDDYRQEALKRYQKLYDATPQFIYKQRIQKLILGR